MAMLNVENVSKSFAGPPPRKVLGCACRCSSRPANTSPIMGESGAGKSTLLNLIAGLDTPEPGASRSRASELGALDDAARTRLRRARMGFVFQAFHLLPHLSVERNVALPLALNGMRGREATDRVAEVLEAVGMQDAPAPRRRNCPAVRCSASRSRARLAHRPALVLADEPTGNLDAESAAEVLELLRCTTQARQRRRHSGHAFGTWPPRPRIASFDFRGRRVGRARAIAVIAHAASSMPQCTGPMRHCARPHVAGRARDRARRRAWAWRSISSIAPRPTKFRWPRAVCTASRISPSKAAARASMRNYIRWSRAFPASRSASPVVEIEAQARGSARRADVDRAWMDFVRDCCSRRCAARRRRR